MVLTDVPPSHTRSWPTPGENRPLIIGFAGGSGSGKTTIANAVVAAVGRDRVTLIQYDSYYRDQSGVPVDDRSKTNFDHPDSLETELLIAHLEELRDGLSIQCPVYDFGTHTRLLQTVTVRPESAIIVEGILVLVDPALRALMDLRIYIDTDSDLRLMRRLRRDIVERDRSVDAVLEQYMATVRPMHQQFVEPSKRFADLIVPEGYNASAVSAVTSAIQNVLATR